MALIRDYALTGGIVVQNAYFVVTTLVAQKRLLDTVPGVEDPVTHEMRPDSTILSQKWDCQVLVSVFKDRATREAGGDPVAVLPTSLGDVQFVTKFEYDPAGDLPVVQAYHALIAQPYFANAVVDTAS